MVLETMYGEYVITGTRLRTALDTEIMLKKNSLPSVNKEEFYKITRSAPSSHGPVDKLNDMVRFGLRTKNNQNYVITTLGEEFLKSDGEERAKIVERIVRNIPLWNKLLDNIGRNPSLDAFSDQVRAITQAKPDIIDRNLTRLYSAYIGDVECTHKSPPYGKVSPLLGRTKETKQLLHVPEVFTPLENFDISEAISDPVDMSITFGDHRVDIKDELTYRFAEQMMVMIKRELARRGVRIYV